MRDVLFIWTAVTVSNMFGAGMRTTLAQRLVYPLFDLCLIKHVLTVWPLTSTQACLVTKQCLMMFGRQTFPVWTGLNYDKHCGYIGHDIGVRILTPPLAPIVMDSQKVYKTLFPHDKKLKLF